MMKQPTARMIRATREQAGLSVEQAAQLVRKTAQSWYSYERGARNIPLDTWELFLIKAGLTSIPKKYAC